MRSDGISLLVIVISSFSYYNVGEVFMLNEISKILYDEKSIQDKVKELANRIDNDYPDGKLLLVCVLKGASVFFSDLIRNIKRPVLIDFISASSYGMASETSGAVKIDKDLDYSIEGLQVIIVEDIIDTGLTLKYLTDNFKSRNPKSLEICTLLDKPARRKTEIGVKYIGYTIPDEFIVGYGIDYAEKYRNLPFIGVPKVLV